MKTVNFLVSLNKENYTIKICIMSHAAARLYGEGLIEILSLMSEGLVRCMQLNYQLVSNL